MKNQSHNVTGFVFGVLRLLTYNAEGAEERKHYQRYRRNQEHYQGNAIVIRIRYRLASTHRSQGHRKEKYWTKANEPSEHQI